MVSGSVVAHFMPVFLQFGPQIVHRFPVLICLIKTLFVVGRFQIVTLYDPNDPNTLVVCLKLAAHTLVGFDEPILVIHHNAILVFTFGVIPKSDTNASRQERGLVRVLSDQGQTLSNELRFHLLTAYDDLHPRLQVENTAICS